MESIPGNDLLLSDRIAKTKLATLHPLCLCSNAIRQNEREIWRAIFFGFTNVSRENYLEFDKESLMKFQRGQLTFFQRPEEWYRFGGNALEGIDPRAIFHLKAVGRRGTLLMIMKVIENVEPNASDLDQVVRDALYFKQFLDSNDAVKEISFGKLESLRTLWEVYVHNLYFISVLEKAFAILLEMLQKNLLVFLYPT